MSFDKKNIYIKVLYSQKALPIIKQIQIINLKKIVIMALTMDNKIFVIYLAIQKQKKILIHLKK